MARQEGIVLTQEQTEAIKRRDDELYERYAKHLEEEHKGKFVAIGLNGETLIGEERVKIILEAVKKFGRGNFAVRKIGYDYELRWS
jgi:hypothetical protein